MYSELPTSELPPKRAILRWAIVRVIAVIIFTFGLFVRLHGDNDQDEYLKKDKYKDKDTYTQTKTNTKCFQDPMYAIFIKSNGFNDFKYCESQQSSVD